LHNQESLYLSSDVVVMEDKIQICFVCLLITNQVVYYETINRELNKRLICECRCDKKRKAKTERSTLLSYTVLCGGLEHLKIKARLIDEKFASVMGECVFVKL
jgi:hypothetical protein